MSKKAPPPAYEGLAIALVTICLSFITVLGIETLARGTKQKFGIPRKLGILNGYVDEQDPSEKACSKYLFSEFKIEDWKSVFLKSLILENASLILTRS